LEKVDSMAERFVGVSSLLCRRELSVEASQSRRNKTKATRKTWFVSLVLLCFVQVINQGGWLCDKAGWAQMARESLGCYREMDRFSTAGASKRGRGKQTS